MIGEVAFFDERVRPDFLEELVLRHEAAGPGGQRRQNVERLRRQQNRMAIPQQETFGHVERKVTELQTNTIVHRSGVKVSLKLQTILAFRVRPRRANCDQSGRKSILNHELSCFQTCSKDFDTRISACSAPDAADSRA